MRLPDESDSEDEVPNNTNEKERKSGMKDKKKRNRRPKKIRRVLNNLTVMYSNMRGLKSKLLSLATNIDEVKPAIICLVETHLDKKEKIAIEGYKTFRLDGTSNSAGILIGVLNSIKTIVVSLEDFVDVGHIKWLLINNGRVAIRMGVIYAPQENVTPINELKKLYDNIQHHAITANNERQYFVVLGDFNCKVGNHIKGNKDTITKGGRLLLKLTRNNRLTIMNALQETKGLWTRVQGNQKSVIDYVILNEKSHNVIQDMIIDEEKTFPIYSNYNNENTYTDHNTMICKLRIDCDMKQEQTKTLMTNKSYSNLMRKMKEENLSNVIVENKTMQENYDRWSQSVERIIDEVKRKRRMNNKRKDERLLIKMIKVIRKNLENEHEKSNIDYLKNRIAIIKEHITALKVKVRADKLKKRVQMIKQKDRQGIWQIKRQINRKEQIQKQIKSNTGVILTNYDDIIKEYENYYTQLLAPKQASTDAEKEVEEKIEKEFNDICKKARDMALSKKISEQEVRDAVKEMKIKKAGDRNGWRNEWLKYGGDEIIKCLTKLFNQMEKELSIPQQWKNIKITSIQKASNGTMLNETQRGLFITNIVSKVYEKVKKKSNMINFQKMSQMQMAGRRHRSTMDNIVIVSSIIAENKARNKPTYLFFGDAEKCFDKLWLKDCLVEIVKLGVSEKDALMLYLMNEEANIVVSTPIGNTNEISIKEVVRQGTVYGPVLCCASTARVNDIGESVVEKCGLTEVGMLVFMDDINTTTQQANNIKSSIRNCRRMEIEKKYTFGMKKTKYMIIDEKYPYEKIEEELEKGIVQRTTEYKYVGIYLNEKGNLTLHKEKMDERAMDNYREIMAMGSFREVGGEFLRVRLMLFEKCWMPAVTNGIHAWTLLTDKDIDDIEQIQVKYLKRLCGLPASTPTAALIMELGIWPATEAIQYLSAMLYHELITSDNQRVASSIIKEQSMKVMKNSLPNRVQEMMKDIGCKFEDIKNLKKSTWKKKVKDAMRNRIDSRLKEKMKDKTKSRFAVTENFGEAKTYISQHTGYNAIDILKIRLNMADTKSNFKSKYKNHYCPKCKTDTDTAEHIVRCFTDVNPTEIYNTKSEEWLNILEGYKKYKGYLDNEEMLAVE